MKRKIQLLLTLQYRKCKSSTLIIRCAVIGETCPTDLSYFSMWKILKCKYHWLEIFNTAATGTKPNAAKTAMQIAKIQQIRGVQSSALIIVNFILGTR
jgi:hypothetical protein